MTVINIFLKKEYLSTELFISDKKKQRMIFVYRTIYKWSFWGVFSSRFLARSQENSSWKTLFETEVTQYFFSALWTAKIAQVLNYVLWIEKLQSSFLTAGNSKINFLFGW